MIVLPYELLALSKQHQAASRKAKADKAGIEDLKERIWIRNNLGVDALERFQATVLGIHRRFDEVMARCSACQAVIKADRGL